jgi:hypothetical protein
MLPKSIVYQMADIASRAIGDALRFGSQHMAAPPRSEAGFVAAIIHRAVADIATGWAPALRTRLAYRDRSSERTVKRCATPPALHPVYAAHP